MSQSLLKINEAYEKLKNYSGDNPYLINLKNGVYVYKNETLNDFKIEYILKNIDFEPIYLSKIVKIADWYGEKKQMEWNTEFVPEKLLIGYYLGETTDFYHMYVKYRKSQEKMLLQFIPKKAVLTDFLSEDWTKKEVDFELYNNKSGLTIKPHQEKAIKFLLTRKKAICSLEQGLGKSLVGIVAALEGKYEKILVICPASLKINWKEEISRFTDESEISIVEGSNWKENKFTIINFDILKKFYTVAKETRKIKEKYIDENGNVAWRTVEKTVKSNKKELVEECLDNSQLFQSQFDLIIIDEAHRLSNKSSGMYEIVDDLIKRSKPQGIFELTGTMIKNNPSNLYNILKLIGADVTADWQYYHKRYCGAKQIYTNKKLRNYYSEDFIKKKNKNSWFDLTPSEKDELTAYLDNNIKKTWIMGEPANLEELSERIKHVYYREVNDFEKLGIKKETILKEYTLTKEEKINYDNSWETFLSTSEEKNLNKLIENHKLIEGSIFRQLLAEYMLPRTIQLAEEEIAKGKRIIIFCSFDKEVYTLQEYFKERCVVYNGKMTLKKKDATLKEFKNNDSIKVFIGNIQAASVGLNLNECSTVIFNTFSFVPSDNAQSEFRCLRIGQDKDVTIYYQYFKDTYLVRMLEILEVKNNITNSIIIDNNN